MHCIPQWRGLTTKGSTFSLKQWTCLCRLWSSLTCHTTVKMFSNNNYLPDLNHYPSAGQQLPSIPPSPQPPDPLPVIPGSSNYARSGNFRFLSPTQGTAVPTWVPPACAVGMATAPGVGANWQHSVPTTLPWANHVPPRFTAQNSLSQSLPVYTMPVWVPM